MAGGGQQADNTLHENAIGWAILLAILAALTWLFWYYFDVQVRDLVRWIRYSEMWIVSLFTGDNYEVFFNGDTVNFNDAFKGNPDLFAPGQDPNTSLYYGVTNYDAQALTYTHLSFFNALAMQPLRLFFVLLLGLAALWSIFRGPYTQFRTKLGLEGLIQRQSKNFPIIAPFVIFNPQQQPPRPPGSPVPAELPPFAEALGPEEWLAYNSIPIPDGKVDKDAAARIFMKQLGGRWKGPEALAPHRQILLAAFCLKAGRKRKDSDEMLGRIARCWTLKGGLKLSKDKTLLKEARAVLRDNNLSGKTLAKCNRHAFETTALIRGLATAREEGGVLSPSQFVWLRAHDRKLWYPLNNLGRQSFHMEALGAMSHYKAEKLTQRPIPVPKIAHAVDTIASYMSSARARPVPQLDYSGSKKRAVKKAK
jgi:intracellular multiplication protein IcmP